MTEEDTFDPASSMAAAVDELLLANEELATCRKESSAARQAECSAENRVNHAQAEIDKLLALLRANTLPGTSWTRSARGS